MALYHPELDDKLLMSAVNRRELALELKARADRLNSQGDAALVDKRWDHSDACWRGAARCMRAFQAVAGAKPTNPGDYEIIEKAWAAVENRRHSTEGEQRR